jgi:hypothetical protein
VDYRQVRCRGVGVNMCKRRIIVMES